MLHHLDQDEAHARALREAEYALLTRRAATANSRALIDSIHQQIVDYEVQQGTRKRKRVGKALAFVRALEGFIGDLLDAFKSERAAGWVRRSVTPVRSPRLPSSSGTSTLSGRRSQVWDWGKKNLQFSIGPLEGSAAHSR